MSIILESITEWLETGLQFEKVNWLCIVTIVAFWSTVWNVITIRRGLSASSWPTAPGVIETSRIASHDDAEYGTMYSPKINYHYTVNKKRYRGSRLQFGRGEVSTSWRSGADRIIAKYPEGRHVNVHFHPARPRVSTLKTGVHGSAWIALLICVGLSGVMTFLCLKELMISLTIPLGTG